MSKFDKYLKESELITEKEFNILVEDCNTILEALGHVDEVDAHELGLPAFKNITMQDIISAMKKKHQAGKFSVKSYLEKLDKAYKGRMSAQDKDQLLKALKLPYWPNTNKADKFGNE